MAEAAEEAKRLREAWRGAGQTGIHEELQRLAGDLVKVRQVYGNTADVLADYAVAVNAAISQWLAPVKQARRNLLFGDKSPLDAEQQFAKIKGEFLSARAALWAGDLSVIDKAPQLVDELLGLARAVTAKGSTGFTDWSEQALQFLNLAVAKGEALGAKQIQLGSAGSPMEVAGVSAMLALQNQQLKVLESQEHFQEKTAKACAGILDKMSSPIGIVGGGVA